jgi:hypothetical protein
VGTNASLECNIPFSPFSGVTEIMVSGVGTNASLECKIPFTKEHRTNTLKPMLEQIFCLEVPVLVSDVAKVGDRKHG